MLQRMPSGPWSAAMHRVSCITAPFETLYGTNPSCAVKPEMEAVLTIAPRPRWRIAGMACLAKKA